MPVIVDTFNVLHQTGILPPDLAGIDVAGLVGLISRSRFARTRVRLVCDGASRLDVDEGDSGRVTIEFSGKGRTADDVIIHHVNRSSAPRRLTIVSSDREIQKAARRRRCEVITSENFLRQLAGDVERREIAAAKANADRPREFRKPLSEREAARWMRELGVDASKLPLTEAQIADLERAAEAMLAGDSQSADDASQPASSPLKRAEARAARARAKEQSQLDAARSHDESALPHDLIEEAERLWKHEQSRRRE